VSRFNVLAENVPLEWNLQPSGVDWTLTRIRDRALDARIITCIREGDRVLDLGCGDGDLLVKVKREKCITERGVELDGGAATEAISRGLSVVHGNLEEALACQGDGSFDVVILNQVIATVADPVAILNESVRVGRRVIVTFPNFAHWKNRLQLHWFGRLPVTPLLPYQWFDTPNIRLLTIKDFRDLCRSEHFRVEWEEFVSIEMNGRVRPVKNLPSMRASTALFVMMRR
jgi:methionine biosynthesis protein MetW